MNDDQELVKEARIELADKWPHPPVMDSWAFVVTEIGEIGDALLRLGYGDARLGYVRTHEKHPDLPGEIADTYLMLITLANHLGIDLSKVLVRRVQEIHDRHS